MMRSTGYTESKKKKNGCWKWDYTIVLDCNMLELVAHMESFAAAQSDEGAVQDVYLGDAPAEPVLVGSVSSCLTVTGWEMTASLLNLLSEGFHLPQASS